LFAGRTIEIFFPQAVFIPRLIKAVEKVGPAITAVAAKLLICTGSRTAG
jgi:hypothetical protein